MVGDEPADHLFLFGLVEPSTHRTPPPPGAQSFDSGLLLSFDPAMNGLAGDAEKAGDLRLGTSFLEGSHRLKADCFLRRRNQRSKILMRLAQKLSS